MKNQEKHFPRSRNTGGARQAAQPAKPASQKSRKLRNQRKTNEKSRKTSPQIKKMPAIQPNQPNQPANNQEIKEKTMKICCSSQIGSSQIGRSPFLHDFGTFLYFSSCFLRFLHFLHFLWIQQPAGWLKFLVRSSSGAPASLAQAKLAQENWLKPNWLKPNWLEPFSAWHFPRSRKSFRNPFNI